MNISKVKILKRYLIILVSVCSISCIRTPQDTRSLLVPFVLKGSNDSSFTVGVVNDRTKDKQSYLMDNSTEYEDDDVIGSLTFDLSVKFFEKIYVLPFFKMGSNSGFGIALQYDVFNWENGKLAISGMSLAGRRGGMGAALGVDGDGIQILAQHYIKEKMSIYSSIQYRRTHRATDYFKSEQGNLLYENVIKVKENTIDSLIGIAYDFEFEKVTPFKALLSLGYSQIASSDITYEKTSPSNYEHSDGLLMQLGLQFSF